MRVIPNFFPSKLYKQLQNAYFVIYFMSSTNVHDRSLTKKKNCSFSIIIPMQFIMGFAQLVMNPYFLHSYQKLHGITDILMFKGRGGGSMKKWQKTCPIIFYGESKFIRKLQHNCLLLPPSAKKVNSNSYCDLNKLSLNLLSKDYFCFFSSDLI